MAEIVMISCGWCGRQRKVSTRQYYKLTKQPVRCFNCGNQLSPAELQEVIG